MGKIRAIRSVLKDGEPHISSAKVTLVDVVPRPLEAVIVRVVILSQFDFVAILADPLTTHAVACLGILFASAALAGAGRGHVFGFSSGRFSKSPHQVHSSTLGYEFAMWVLMSITTGA